MISIIGIGLSAAIQRAIQDLSLPPRALEFCETFATASDFLCSEDLSMVLFDSHATNRLRQDVNDLLGDTPLTTKLVMITHPDDMISLEPFHSLGIRTLNHPIKSTDLRDLFSNLMSQPTLHAV